MEANLEYRLAQQDSRMTWLEKIVERFMTSGFGKGTSQQIL